METRETWLRMAVTHPDQSQDQPDRLPMRQSSGGVPVVVRDVNDDYMAKGRRMVRSGSQRRSPHLEGSR